MTVRCIYCNSPIAHPVAVAICSDRPDSCVHNLLVACDIRAAAIRQGLIPAGWLVSVPQAPRRPLFDLPGWD